MRLPYHDLTSTDFERLTVAACVELLGPGVQPFTSGPDGGRDARFAGTAMALPSANGPYSGQFVIQAKHTEDPAAKFSDPDFSGDAPSSVLTIEIPRVRRLVQAGELDHYLLVSNRRLAGLAEETIRRRIINETGARSVELFGVERLDLLLRRFPQIVLTADIRLLDAPLIVSPDDLADVITAFQQHTGSIATAIADVSELRRTAFSVKNAVNGLSADFASEIVSRYLKDFESVRHFLSLPASASVLDRYNDAAREFHEQILAHRGDFEDFGRVLVHLQRLLFERDRDLARNKRLTKLVIYYMYWNCDFGTEAA